MKSTWVITGIVATLTLCTLFLIIKFATAVGTADKAAAAAGALQEDHPVVRLLSSGFEHSYKEAIEASSRYPYIAAIVTRDSSRSIGDWSFTCFGSVIRMKWIVTAAHCQKSGHSHRVILYYNYIRNNTQSHLIVQWVVHAGFNANVSVPWHDIALARTNEDLQPIVNQQDLITANQVQAGIWKTLKNMDHRTYLTNDFDIYNADIIDPQRCYEFYGFTLDYTLLCVDMSRYSYCFMTEFGPVFTARERVLGILKVKPNNCDLKVAVFTNVSAYTDWILEVTQVGNKPAL